ncbi:hypothetical protein CAPTEDRAFT_210670 [Capitella teleta]|uniref:DUF4371 domain-containing protein n=1 Tax=Capitella teleta TaxID=283909 RepID=R7U910_CAPTE|nr:hypothetical protein CAPTEDRAFT_210670 [Capitella teleta]|eukprot:ELU02845.1 hypothetical protein CAPTEDRAFT_210670 [Capitella teleta]
MTYVVEVQCRLCGKHIDQLKSDEHVKGKITDEVEVYISGSENVKKPNIVRHLTGRVHEAIMQYEKLLKLNPDPGSLSKPSSQPEGADYVPPAQPRINSALRQVSWSAYEKLFKTAYRVAVDGLPLKAFTSMVKLQKENGIQLLQGCDCPQWAAEMIGIIAEQERLFLKDILTKASAFSVLTDGSQARKTRSENDSPWGTGIYSGVLIRLKGEEEDKDADESDTLERPWVVTIHCISHRFELAVKDSLLNKTLNMTTWEVREFLISLCYLFKKSPKLSRHQKATEGTVPCKMKIARVVLRAGRSFGFGFRIR